MTSLSLSFSSSFSPIRTSLTDIESTDREPRPSARTRSITKIRGEGAIGIVAVVVACVRECTDYVYLDITVDVCLF